MSVAFVEGLHLESLSLKVYSKALNIAVIAEI